jgi:hypothetical protein
VQAYADRSIVETDANPETLVMLRCVIRSNAGVFVFLCFSNVIHV